MCSSEDIYAIMVSDMSQGIQREWQKMVVDSMHWTTFSVNTEQKFTTQPPRYYFTRGKAYPVNCYCVKIAGELRHYDSPDSLPYNDSIDRSGTIVRCMSMFDARTGKPFLYVEGDPLSLNCIRSIDENGKATHNILPSIYRSNCMCVSDGEQDTHFLLEEGNTKAGNCFHPPSSVVTQEFLPNPPCLL